LLAKGVVHWHFLIIYGDIETIDILRGQWQWNDSLSIHVLFSKKKIKKKSKAIWKIKNATSTKGQSGPYKLCFIICSLFSYVYHTYFT
jgi:hypothetical protein